MDCPSCRPCGLEPAGCLDSVLVGLGWTFCGSCTREGFPPCHKQRERAWAGRSVLPVVRVLTAGCRSTAVMWL